MPSALRPLLAAALLMAPCLGAGPAERLALVVGIDRYAAPAGGKAAFPDLRGCISDARRFARLLRSPRFGFGKGDVRLLLDEQATRAEIVRAFRQHLIDRAGPGTQVVFYYAGHGSRVPDVSGHEPDGLESSLVTHRARAQADPGDLVDDLLHSLLRELCRKRANVLVITDCCHAGDVTRGETRRNRSAPAGARAPSRERMQELLPPGVTLYEDQARLAAQPYVHLAACGPRQLAVEDRFADGSGGQQHAGVFSWILCDELARLRKGASYEELTARVAMRMALLRSRTMQRPELTGPEKLQVLGDSYAETLPGFAVRQQQGSILVEAGLLHGLRKGSVLRANSWDGRSPGELELTRVWRTRARARWRGAAPERVPAPLRALLVEEPAGVEPLRVFLAAEVGGEAFAAQLASALGNLVQFVRDPAAPVDARFSGRDPWELWALPENWRLAEGASSATKLWVRRLRDELQYRTLIGLQRSEGTIPVELELFVPDTAQIRAWSAEYPDLPRRSSLRFGAQRAPAQLQLRMVSGDRRALVGVRVRLPTSSPHPRVHAALFSLTSERALWPIRPASRAAFGVPRALELARGQEWSVPVELWHLPEGWPAGQPYLDRFLLLVSERYADYRPLVRHEEQPSLGAGAQGMAEALRARPVTRGGEGGLPAALAHALSGGRTRGRRVRRAHDAFAVRCIDVIIERVSR